MKLEAGEFVLSASDLVGFLNCRHLSTLERAAAEGALERPTESSLFLELLRDRGDAHERRYFEHLRDSGREIVHVDGFGVTEEAVEETRAAMRSGADAIAQAALSGGGWAGRADVLLRVEKPSGLGDWSYEATDAKLARETKAGAVLQLCLYSSLLAEAQGIQPERMHVVRPWTDFEPQEFRFANYAAYFRKVQQAFRDSLAQGEAEETYPDPKAHCNVCRWSRRCEARRRGDDHPCLVAGIFPAQIEELRSRGVVTMKRLSELPLPMDPKPERGSTQSYEKIREQARVQVEGRESGELRFEMLPVEEGFGLTRLPEPSPGDVFLDLEGDPFVGEAGLEYLFGYAFQGDDGDLVYEHKWALSREDEKRAFEKFVDFAMERWERFGELRIYHYGHYEPSALKRLMGRYATREEDIDAMLRADTFVDLAQVVRRGLRASIESYSIKRLEPFYGFERGVGLPTANAALAQLHAYLELEDAPSLSENARDAVRDYNRDDCMSAARLRDWLEELREGLVTSGEVVPRPKPSDGAPSEAISEWQNLIDSLVERLTAGIPADPAERSPEQQASWTLANVVDWHRREEKPGWWEYFRLAGLAGDDLIDERAGLFDLQFVGEVDGEGNVPTHRYSFPQQDFDIRIPQNIHMNGGDRIGSLADISAADLTIDIKKYMRSADVHPEAVFAHFHISTDALSASLVRLSEYAADHGLPGEGDYQAARDLLLRTPPRVGGQPLKRDDESTLEAAKRLCGHLDGGVLPIQGPPGAGKTFTGAHMICELVRAGKTVGITANSHKVIRNLIDKAIDEAGRRGLDLNCCHKVSRKPDEPEDRLSVTTSNEDILGGLAAGLTHVGGGTAWLWARPEAFEAVDVLFVDEAAQMSLANVLAVSQAAGTVVLIGDPRQLDQPMQGTHPDGAGISALEHILDGKQTIGPEQGLFLGDTWRLHPEICRYTSELFYEGRLTARQGLDRQVVKSTGVVSGSGLLLLPVEHSGNTSSSVEEATAVTALVGDLLQGNASWVGQDGSEQAVGLDDILIVTPYNAQIHEIRRLLDGANVGTVDKFQGQEAPVAIYSMATSSPADAPRGMEFLYSLNRLNVATSRARCLSVIVCSPQLFEAECRTPRQMELANAFCRYLELATPLDPAKLGPE